MTLHLPSGHNRDKIKHLGIFFYNIFLLLFKAGVHTAAIFNGKAKKWVQGRRGIFEKLQKAIAGNERIIWVHCASLGEFEQGRPLIEKLKEQNTHKILLTFFSPSGYEIRKDYTGADWVFYLPMDGAKTARRFLEIVKPSLVIFVKYEFWYYYLKKIKYRNIPLLLVSALFLEKMSFFKWYGAIQRKILSRFDHLFVQNQSSKQLIDGIGLADICSVSGDTRFDRVVDIAEKATSIPLVEHFVSNKKVIVAGSTWPEDESVLEKAISTFNDPLLKLIIAPHEINPEHIASLQKKFTGAVLFSQLSSGKQLQTESNVLIIDNIGLLSRLYQYAAISYIGGGFGKGIHNTLEAAVYGHPVIFGPVHHKFKEAIDLIEKEAAVTIHTAEELQTILQTLLNNETERERRGKQAKNYVYTNTGATNKIFNYIQEKRLLTN